jgi:hypothetical protein
MVDGKPDWLLLGISAVIIASVYAYFWGMGQLWRAVNNWAAGTGY